MKFHLACVLNHYENLRVKKALVNFVYSITKYIIGSPDSVNTAYTRSSSVSTWIMVIPKYCMKSETCSSDLIAVADKEAHVLKKHVRLSTYLRRNNR